MGRSKGDRSGEELTDPVREREVGVAKAMNEKKANKEGLQPQQSYFLNVSRNGEKGAQ